jgi:hypothetical protein
MSKRQRRLLHREKLNNAARAVTTGTRTERKNPAESPHTPPDLIRVGTRESHPLPHAPHTELTAAATDLLMISHGLASGQIQRGVRVRHSGRLLVNCANSHPNQKMKSRTGFPNHIFLPYYFARPNFQTSENPSAVRVPFAKNFKNRANRQ